MYFKYRYNYIGGHGFMVGVIKADNEEEALAKLKDYYKPALKIQLNIYPIDILQDPIEIYEEYN